MFSLYGILYNKIIMNACTFELHSFLVFCRQQCRCIQYLNDLIDRRNHIMKKDKEISVPLLAFTFFYSVTIYLFLLGFYFWHWHKNDPAETDK